MGGLVHPRISSAAESDRPPQNETKASLCAAHVYSLAHVVSVERISKFRSFSTVVPDTAPLACYTSPDEKATRGYSYISSSRCRLWATDRGDQGEARRQTVVVRSVATPINALTSSATSAAVQLPRDLKRQGRDGRARPEGQHNDKPGKYSKLHVCTIYIYIYIITTSVHLQAFFTSECLHVLGWTLMYIVMSASYGTSFWTFYDTASTRPNAFFLLYSVLLKTSINYSDSLI